MQLLKDLLLQTQEEMWNLLTSLEFEEYSRYSKLGKYVYFEHKSAGMKPLIISHIDTINDMYDEKLQPTDIIEHNGIIALADNCKRSCLGGDDRVGNYCMLEMMYANQQCDFLFTCYEEVGGEGAKDFSDNKDGDWTCLIEIDRAGTNHIATYGYDNDKLAKILGLPIQQGSYTDLVDIAKTTKLAGYNIACGYYRQHTKSEYIVISEVMAVLELLNPKLIKKLSKQEFTHNKPRYAYNSLYSFKDKSDDDDVYTWGCCDSCRKFGAVNDYGLCDDCMEDYR